nr:immunoglobulin light chain junction region [Macaca mulatta]
DYYCQVFVADTRLF